MKNESSSGRALGRALCAGLACAACGTVAVRVPVMKPAEVNMAAYPSVAIGGMSGNGERMMSDALEEALINSQRFTVVDRQHLAQVMSELKLSASDLANPASTTRLGNVVTATALIFADVTDSYREQPSEDHYKDDKGKPHVSNVIKGMAQVRATFRIVDVATGRLIAAKTYEETREDSSTGIDKRAAPLDRAALENGARQAVLDRFMKAIVPHQEFMEANFQKDSDLPQLEGGIGYAERGDWKNAQATFNKAAQDAEKNVKLKSGQVAKCYWDLGLSYEYAGDYDKATDTINKAYKLSNDSDMLAELDNVKRLQSDAKRLAEETAPGAAGAR